mgnify:CR=1 FL=1
MIKSSGPPDKTTPGNVGDIYQNTDNGEIFVCKDINHRPVRQQFIEVSAKDVNTEYVWETTKVEPYPEPIKFDDCTEIFKENRRLGYIDKFDFSETTNMSSMFHGCSSLTTIPQMNTSKVTNMSSMFDGCRSLTTIPQMNTSKVITMSSTFSGCTSLTTIPQMDTSKVTNMSSMFYACSSLTTIPQMDTSDVTNMNTMFRSCSSLTTIPQMNTSKVTNMSSMFDGCRSLTTIPQMNTSKVITMSSTFSGCTSLTTIPQMDTSKVTNMSSMFSGCSSLTTIPQMDTSDVTNISSMFSGCSSLTNLDLRNIKVNLQIGSGTSWGHLLTVDSLVNTIKELVTQTSYKTLTMGTANLEKIANLYCKIIDDTDPKKTMELCESTEEGAMTLTDYAQLKKWNIK